MQSRPARLDSQVFCMRRRVPAVTPAPLPAATEDGTSRATRDAAGRPATGCDWRDRRRYVQLAKAQGARAVVFPRSGGCRIILARHRPSPAPAQGPTGTSALRQRQQCTALPAEALTPNHRQRRLRRFQRRKRLQLLRDIFRRAMWKDPHLKKWRFQRRWERVTTLLPASSTLAHGAGTAGPVAADDDVTPTSPTATASGSATLAEPPAEKLTPDVDEWLQEICPNDLAAAREWWTGSSSGAQPLTLTHHRRVHPPTPFIPPPIPAMGQSWSDKATWRFSGPTLRRFPEYPHRRGRRSKYFRVDGRERKPPTDHEG